MAMVAAGTLTLLTVLDLQGQTINPGERRNGAIVVGSQDSFTIAADSGDQIIARAGGTNFTPLVQLYGPGDVLLSANSSSSVNNRDGEAIFRATNSGTFTVTVSSYYAGGAGTYGLNVSKAPGEITVSSGDQGGSLTNGWQHTGVIDVGDLDQWNVSANSGDSMIVRMGGTSFAPQLRVYDANGVLQGQNISMSVNNRDAEVSFRATNNGVFTVVANSYYLNGSGAYRLSLAKSPEAIAIAPGDEGGPLTNGWLHAGVIEVGDLDEWSLTANADDTIVLRAGAGTFTPLLRLYDPNGLEVAVNLSMSLNNRDGEVSFRATNSGTFTVVVGSYYLNGSGSYQLSMARSPGEITVAPDDEGGSLTNNWRHAGVVDIGDLDEWQLSANEGDTIILRAGGTGFTPLIRLFDPDGAEVAANSSSSVNNRDGEASFRANSSGIYTVVVSTYYLNGSGEYALSLAQSPSAIAIALGDEGGELINGWQHVADIPVGDLDQWSFEADAGDSIALRAGGTGFTPLIRLFGPDGTAVAASSSSSVNNRDAELTIRATNSGTFTAVVSTFYLNGSGPYRLNLAKSPGTFQVAPGDEGGALTESPFYNGEIDQGDSDVWTFTACIGERITFDVAGTNFTPWIRLFGPDGTLHTQSVSFSVNTRSATITYFPTNCGTFTMVLGSYYLNGAGSYQITDSGLLHAMRICPPLISGSNATVFGVGGPVGADAVLLRSEILQTPGSNWTTVSTNQFDSLGLFQFIDRYEPGETTQFYRFRLQPQVTD